MIQQIFDNVIEGFDLSYCLVVNIFVYLIIKCFEIKDKCLTKWQKRIVLVIVIAIMATLYHFIGESSKILINSSILAPVSWSWIFKPLCKIFKVDYNKDEISTI